MKTIIALTLLLTVLLAGCTTTEQEAVTEIVTEDTESLERDNAPNDQEITTEAAVGLDVISGFQGKVLTNGGVPYVEFNQADYDKAVAEDKTILLNFYATWCPNCRSEQPKAIEAYESLDNADLIAFRVNYRDPSTDDFEEGLARKHGVTYQGTKVIIQNGEQVTKTVKHWSTDEYVTELSTI